MYSFSQSKNLWNQSRNKLFIFCIPNIQWWVSHRIIVIDTSISKSLGLREFRQIVLVGGLQCWNPAGHVLSIPCLRLTSLPRKRFSADLGSTLWILFLPHESSFIFPWEIAYVYRWVYLDLLLLAVHDRAKGFFLYCAAFLSFGSRCYNTFKNVMSFLFLKLYFISVVKSHTCNPFWDSYSVHWSDRQGVLWKY